MPKFTPEQQEAIDKTGSNIIVSAGAGSGKTAVLSQRVLKKIEDGIHVNELLILTFTEAAAAEMKDRIRKKLTDDPKYKSELDKLNSAYISTFDAFALSVVKRYSYLLNVSNDISISDESLVSLEQEKIIDEIFEELYKTRNESFISLINKYCVKNDNYFREDILLLAKQISNKIDYKEYLDNIENNYFSEKNINSIINDYKEFISNNRKFINSEIDNLEYYFDSDFVDKIRESVHYLLTCDIDELGLIEKVKLPSVPRGSSDEAKSIKARFKSSCDALLKYGEYGTLDEIKKSIIDHKEIILTIIQIIREFIKKLDEYKKINHIYTFADIASLSIKILKENESVRNELKYSFKEIMIDEYQDTNDIQDMFISLIENNNVYMVGDIKQSIYKFRGSNPSIFKDKYDNYSNGNGGYKIDLIKNFRSRNEVVNNINSIFKLLMDDSIGGADYVNSHQMIFGNTAYNQEYFEGLDYNINIHEYELEKDSIYSKTEVEAFAIAKDIKDKMSSKLKVFDKDTNKMRDANYSDFAIILDRGTVFTLYKKIFEYSGIPLTIMKDEKLNEGTEIYLIKNILDIILRINNNDFDVEFKYDFISIARSFLYELNDKEIFNIIINKKYKETKIYKDFSSFDSINSMTSSELLNEILDITDFYNKISKIGDYENINVKLSNIFNMANSLNGIGYGIEDFINYLNDIIERGVDIKYSAFASSTDSVRLMTIHRSKGLEYPICYFAELSHDFNLREIYKRFICDNKYGLIVPFVLSDNDNSITKLLYKNNYIKEEISERLRLFYVALTRAREKIIIFIPKKETLKLEKDENGVILESRRLDFGGLCDFVYGIKDYVSDYFDDLDINSINLKKDYLYKKDINSIIKEKEDNIKVEEINIENNLLEESHFSKETNELLTKEITDVMKYGTKVHEVLELVDFKNYDESIIEDEFIRSKVTKFMNSDLLKNVKSCNDYHEYEFTYIKDDTLYHGVIDLMLEYDDHIDIVDYKLKNISDEKYLNQLNGYKDYISSITNKQVNLYLYSILDEKIDKL